MTTHVMRVRTVIVITAVYGVRINTSDKTPRVLKESKIDTELYLTEERTGSHVPGLTVLLLWSVRVRPVLLWVQGEELDHHATALHDLPRVCAHRLGHHARPNRTAVACLSGT